MSVRGRQQKGKQLLSITLIDSTLTSQEVSIDTTDGSKRLLTENPL
jgi:hypothetical protein